MQITAKLKSFSTETLGVKADASDEEFKKAVGEAITSGKLTAAKFAELSLTKEDEEASEVKSLFKGLGDALTEIRDAMKKPAEKAEEKPETKEEETEKKEAKPEQKKDGNRPVSALEKMVSSMSSFQNTDDDIDDEEKSFSVRVKQAAEAYSTTKSAMMYPTADKSGRMHPLAGRPVMDYKESGKGRQIDNPSELDQAVNGAYWKFLVLSSHAKSKRAALERMTQHERELLYYSMENCKWGGTTDALSDDGGPENIRYRKLFPNEQKALIDDSTSGGLEAAPISFDDDLITTPLLHGELFPMVNTVPIERGRRIEGVAVSNVTGSWGGVDDTAITLFNTASYVTAFDTTIFRWEGAVVVGLDFLSDTPIDFNRVIVDQYGQRMLKDLDDAIATGNGTTAPEGISVKSGTTSVAFGGSTTIGNYESLRAGVPKNEHQGVAQTAIFCGSETSYFRAKAIPVGASDARRLSNTVSMPSYDDYRWMDRPYKVNESLGNTKIFYAIMARYRMYRRRGLSVRTSTEGSTLIRGNEMLIAVTARWGGHLERGACAAYTSTAPA